MTKRKTIQEVRERHDRLARNLSLITNRTGNDNVKREINTLKIFLDNPNINLEGEIKNSYGTERQAFRWIAGEVI
jgi:hypothetical protein